jgi:hypothetical protein
LGTNETLWENQFLVPPPVLLDNSIPFKECLELIVDIPVDPRGINSIYIDNIISLVFDIEGSDNLVRCHHVPLLDLDTCSCPLNPINRSPKKPWKQEIYSIWKPSWRSKKLLLDGSTTHHQTPRQQIQHVDNFNQEDDR